MQSRFCLFFLSMLLVSSKGMAADQSFRVLPSLGKETAITASGSYLAADEAFRRGNYKAAIDFIEQSLGNAPTDTELVYFAVRVYLLAGRFDKALSLSRIIPENKQSSMQKLILMVHALKNKHFEKAEHYMVSLGDEGVHALLNPLIRAWVSIAEKKPELDAVQKITIPLLRQSQLGFMYEAMGQKEAALKAVHGAYENFEALSYYHLRDFKRLYQRLRATEDVQKIDQYLQKINPGFPKIPGYNKPKSFSAQEGFAKAFFELAMAMDTNHDLATIFAVFAETLNAKDLGFSIFIATQHLRFGRSNEALRVLQSTRNTGRYLPLIQRVEAAAYKMLDKPEKAIEIYKDIISKNPHWLLPVLNLSVLYQTQNKFDVLVPLVNQFLLQDKTVSPAFLWQLYYARGVGYERLKQWDKAEPDLKKALELNPENPYIMNYLGYSWVEQGLNLDAAFELLKKAALRQPKDGHIIDSLGWSYFKRGELQEALIHLERAVELQPLDPVLNEHLGDVYQALDRRLEAQSQWHRALEFITDAAERKRIEKKLQG